MVDYQNAANEMKVTEKRIRDSFTELGAVDYQRAEHFYDYFKHSRQEDLERFLKKTIASRAPLQTIRGDFRKILRCLSLIEKDAYKHHSFRSALSRIENMQSIFGDFFRFRRTQIRACRSLLRSKDIQSPLVKKAYEVYRKGLFKVQEKRLILAFGKERDLVTLFEGYFKQERERIDAAFQEYLNEKSQNMSMTEVPLAVVVLTPVVGAALGLAVDSSFQWANKYGFNHKMLVKPSAHGRKDGLTL